MLDLTKTKAFLIDLDGTIYFKGKPIPGTIEAIEELKKRGYHLRFLTNTDSKKNTTIAENMNKMGYSVNADEIFNPPQAFLYYMNQHKGKSAYFVVSEDVSTLYSEIPQSEINPDFVVIGDVRGKNLYERLNTAFRCILNGADLIALQTTMSFYNKEGINLDTGAFVHLLESVSDKKHKLIGKPASWFFEIIIKELNLTKDEVVIVGDDITTDILGANDLGCQSVLIKMGKYNDQKDKEYPYYPSIEVDTFSDILKI